MGLPEPIEPQPDDDAPAVRDDDGSNWLCGPEEGLESEALWRAAGQSAPAPKLIRPGGANAPGDPEPGAVTERRGGPHAPRGPVGAVAPEDDTSSDISRGPAMVWEPGANSVPVLSHAPAPEEADAPPAAPPQPDPAMDFPMDDAEERARASAEAAAAAEQAGKPHAVVAPDAFDLRDAPVPWWMMLPQLLREDRRAQALAGLVVVALLTVMFWPKAEKSLSLGSIRRDPAAWDGRAVKVAGRIGEVFEVGGGHAFYLHQGRDTLVVFTRSRSPRRGDRVALIGTVSTGYLNGQSGTALFETAQP